MTTFINSSKNEKIENFVQEFKQSSDTYQHFMGLLSDEMDAGLNRTTHHEADVKMFPTYVHTLPNGTEAGTYLTLELCGSNFRVLLVNVNSFDVIIKSRTFLIPKRIILSTGTQLFDHVADCIGQFVEEHGLVGHLLLSFMFPFPCKQSNLSTAQLSKWTKDFQCDEVIGRDISQLLEDSITRRTSANIQCVAVLNDGVGTLMSAAHSDPNCHIGLVIGTGFNACYMEKLGRIECLDESDNHPLQMIVNTEWGAFGDSGCLDFIQTRYDREADRLSINPGKQTLEKMVSSMYLGEIARQVFEHLIHEHLLFEHISPTCELLRPGRFFTKHIAEIESDDDEFHSHTVQILRDFGVTCVTLEDCEIVKYICSLISTRASYLIAAAIATLINRLEMPEVTIAVDGSLYRFHPKMQNLIKFKVQELIHPHLKFKLKLSNDGSGKGAALVAAIAERQHRAIKLLA